MSTDALGAPSIEAVALDDPVVAPLLELIRLDQVDRYGDDDGVALDPADFAPPRGAFLVARDGRRLVGCGGIEPLPDRPGTAELKRMFVTPQCRGRGIARRLLAALERAAADLGYRTLWLGTGERQPEALALYRSSGYRPIEKFFPYSQWRLASCWAKDLE